jgi:hypothetical protein
MITRDREEKSQLKNNRTEDDGMTLADYMMTKEQYERLFQSKEIKDADLMLLKLK